jgi:hypothetical protein
MIEEDEYEYFYGDEEDETNVEYRLVRDESGVLSVREAFLDNEGNLLGYSEPVSPLGFTMEEFMEDFAEYKKAIEGPAYELG